MLRGTLPHMLNPRGRLCSGGFSCEDRPHPHPTHTPPPLPPPPRSWPLVARPLRNLLAWGTTPGCTAPSRTAPTGATPCRPGHPSWTRARPCGPPPGNGGAATERVPTAALLGARLRREASGGDSAGLPGAGAPWVQPHAVIG